MWTWMRERAPIHIIEVTYFQYILIFRLHVTLNTKVSHSVLSFFCKTEKEITFVEKSLGLASGEGVIGSCHKYTESL